MYNTIHILMFRFHLKICEWDASCQSVVYDSGLTKNQRCMTSPKSRYIGGLSIILDTTYTAMYFEKYQKGTTIVAVVISFWLNICR